MQRVGRHGWMLALVSAALLTSLLAQSNSTYTVRGMVTDVVTGQPIAHALVEISHAAAVLTDSGGQFDFSQIPAGYYSISAGKPGYVTRGSLNIRGAVPSLGTPPQPVNLTVGPTMNNVTIALTPEAVVTGAVRSASGGSLDKISVQAYVHADLYGRPGWRPLGSTTTDISGTFHLGGLPAGTYVLVALSRRLGTSNWMYPPAYYPGKPDGTDYLNLLAGATQDVEISLTRQKLYPVSVTVSAPSPDAFFPGVFDTEGLRFPAAVSVRGGEYNLLLPNGTWTLQDSRGGNDGWFGQTQVTVDGAPASASLTALPNAGVPLEFDRELTGPAQATPAQWLGANLTFFAADAPPLTQQAIAIMQSRRDTDGSTSYAVSAPRPGSYWLATHSAQSYVSSATQGVADLAEKPALIGPGAPPIEITLRNDFGFIAAQVALAGSNSGPSPVYVCAIPLFPTTQLPIMAGAGQQPGAAFANVQLRVPPGSYRILVFPNWVDMQGRASDLAQTWAGKGQVVNALPGQTANVMLSTISAPDSGGGNE